MSKYDPLRDFLDRLSADEWIATFAEIEAIIGFPLPASATAHRTWWANHGGVMVHQNAWLTAGWRVSGVDRGGGRVRFLRAGAGASRPPEPTTTGSWAVVTQRIDHRILASVRRHAAPAELSVRIDWEHHGAAVRDGRSWRCPVIAAAPGLVRLHVFRRGQHGFLVRSARNLTALAHPPRVSDAETDPMWRAMRMAEAVVVDYALERHVQIVAGGVRRPADFQLSSDLALAEAAAVAHSHHAGLHFLGAD